MHIEGKVVLITGATGGLGAALAREFSARGARLAVTGRSDRKLAALDFPVQFSRAGDLLNAEFRRDLIQQVNDALGGADILVNNAGVGLYAPSDRAPMDLIRQMFELNLFAAIDLTQQVLPLMRRKHGGMIVNVSSIAGRLALPWLTMYSASKFALCAFTEGIRMEFGHQGVQAMTVMPGYIRTPFPENVLGGKPPQALRKPARVVISAEECARRVVDGVENDAREVIAPASGRWLLRLARLMPGLTESRLAAVNRQMEQRP